MRTHDVVYEDKQLTGMRTHGKCMGTYDIVYEDKLFKDIRTHCEIHEGTLPFGIMSA